MRSLVILILISVAVSCSQTEEETEEVPPQLIEIQQIADSLIAAYNENSVQKLNSFLEYWSTITYAHQTETFDNDTIRNVYNIYQTLYNPFDLSDITRGEIDIKIYADLSFVVIQNKIYFDFNFDGSIASERDSIVDFRPTVSFPEVKTIYLTSEFKEALNIYLGSYPNLTNRNNADILYQSIYDVEEKIDFLSQSLAIIPSIWGDYWHIETQPEITTVHFTPDLNKARINFRFGYIVGEILLLKESGVWFINDSSFHIIE